MTIPLIAWPIQFAATTRTLRVTINSVTEDLTFGTLTVGRNYWVTGDAQADADGSVGGVGDLLALLAACIETHSEAPTVTVTLTSSWRVEVVIDDGATSSTHTIHWTHGNTTLDGAIFGFIADVTDAGTATTHTGTQQPQGLWRPQREIQDDSRDRQPLVRGISRSLSGLSRVSDFGTPRKERDLTWTLVPQERVLDEYAAGPHDAFEFAWVNAIGLGRPLRLYADEDDVGVGASAYSLYETRDLEEPYQRDGTYRVRWRIDLRLSLIAAAASAAASFVNTYSLEFDGVNEYASGGNLTTLNGVAQAAFSWWMLIPAWVPNDNIWGRFSGTNRPWVFQTASSGNLLIGFGTSAASNYRSTSGAPFPVGSWAHCLVVFDGTQGTATDRMRLYIDDVEPSYAAAVGTFPTTIQSVASLVMQIAGLGGGSTANTFTGSLDEAAIFTAIPTAGQRAEIYNGGTPPDLMSLATMAQPAHYWRMGDGATYPTIPDIGAVGGFDLTMTNMEAGDIVANVP